MINKLRLIKLTQQLVRINSENPGGTEFEIAYFVKDYLDKLGLKTKIYEFQKRRSNIIAVLEGKNKKRSLLITPHLDTVPAGKNWTIPPFKGVIRKGKLYGLGATDCKCNLAVAMEVIRSLVANKVKLGYNLIFAATADEESGSELGLELLLKKKILKPDAALVLDADDFHIVVAQKGLIHMKVKIKGKKAHGAYPWLGVNAIDKAIDIIKEIKAYKFRQEKNNYLRPPTINLGTIKGGDKVNIVADWCEFELDFRFLPKEDAGRIIKSVKNIIKKHARNFQIEIQGVQEPFVINELHPLVKNLEKAMQAVKVRPMIKGSEGATTISFFQEIGIPSLAIGFGTEKCAHLSDEYVLVKNLYKGALVLEEFLENYRF
jgi:succinyl-diaminopimelate desuccinylase